uniref:PEROXIDASE_4 domain-containing protein n=1 Tax=Echinostoma caproni TaxID=27848 RepID=A0A183BEA6_9TREM
LEACDPEVETHNHPSGDMPICPFSWPSSAVAWADDFVRAASLSCTGAESVYLTPADRVRAFMSGLGSLDPAVDPLSELRKLAKQLRTIETVRNTLICIVFDQIVIASIGAYSQFLMYPQKESARENASILENLQPSSQTREHIKQKNACVFVADEKYSSELNH